MMISDGSEYILSCLLEKADIPLDINYLPPEKLIVMHIDTLFGAKKYGLDNIIYCYNIKLYYSDRFTSSNGTALYYTAPTFAAMRDITRWKTARSSAATPSVICFSKSGSIESSVFLSDFSFIFNVR